MSDTIAYLTNQYPKVSHSFIRREILALESQGQPVARFSIRPSPDRLVDPADVAEKLRTRVVLHAGPFRLLTASLLGAITMPRRWVRALVLAAKCGRNSNRGLLRHLVYFSEASVLKDWLEQEGCRHVHAHFGTNSTTVAMLCAELGGPPYSFTVHGPEEFDDAIGLGLKEKIRRAAFVVAISEFGRSQLFRWCGSDQWPKIEVVRCGLDATSADGPPHPIPSEPRLVCVGRLCAQKGQLLLVEALGRLADEGLDFRMIFVGDGEMRGQIETMIRARGLETRCTITGWASGEEVRRLLLSARALVLPSFAEGLPAVLMEALALARPVVSTYVAGIPELVESGVNGWLIPAGSITELVGTIRQVLDAAPERLESLGKAGATKARQQHRAVNEAVKLKKLFDQNAPGSAGL